MRYYGARFKQKQTDEVYRIYVTDGFYALTNRGQRLGKRYADIANPDRNEQEETRTPEEIIQSISDKLKRMASE